MKEKNIILIVMDTARAQNLSCYDHERKTTPFLDSIVETGFKVENCYANAPWTLPSHYSMFTGKYPSEHGRISKDDKGKYVGETLPVALSDEGYKTIGISNNAFVSSVYGFGSMFDSFHFNGAEDPYQDSELFQGLREGEEERRWGSKKQKYLYFLKELVKRGEMKNLLLAGKYLYEKKFLSEWGDDGAEETERIVKEELENHEEPFFLFINYVEPHSLYLPPKKYAKKFLDRDLDDVYRYASQAPTNFIGAEDEEKADILERLYDAELNYLDHKLEEIHEVIESSTERKNVFLFVGDHGEIFGKDGLWEHHGSLDEEVLKVPFIVSESGRSDVKDVTELKEIYDYIIKLVEGGGYSFGSEIALAEYYGFSSHMWKEPPNIGLDNYAVTAISDSSQVIDAEGKIEIIRGKEEEKIKEKLRNHTFKEDLNNIDF